VYQVGTTAQPVRRTAAFGWPKIREALSISGPRFVRSPTVPRSVRSSGAADRLRRASSGMPAPAPVRIRRTAFARCAGREGDESIAPVVQFDDGFISHRVWVFCCRICTSLPWTPSGAFASNREYGCGIVDRLSERTGAYLLYSAGLVAGVIRRTEGCDNTSRFMCVGRSAACAPFAGTNPRVIKRDREMRKRWSADCFTERNRSGHVDAGRTKDLLRDYLRRVQSATRNVARTTISAG
jgi:hypothetical protein